MENYIKQYRFAVLEAGASQTYIRHGWIPTVVQVKNPESRRVEQRQPAFPDHWSKNTKRWQGWIAWAKS